MGNIKLTFNDALHEYRANGIIVPSVTQIISAVGLYDFDHVSSNTLRVATERGRIVHTYIEWYEQGELDEDSIDPELAGYFYSYLETKAAGLLPDKPSAIEKHIYSDRYKYAGTLDQMFGDDWINDIKTGQPSAEQGLQFSAYWLAGNEDMTIKPRRLTGTYLHSDGTCGEVIDYQYEPLIWLAFLADYNWRKKNNKIKQRWQ